MRDIDYAGLNTTLRVYETQLLSRSDFDTMLNAPTLKEALSVLTKTNYEVPDDVDLTKDFDGFLNKRLMLVYEELLKTAVDPRVIELYTLRYTFHNLKVLFKQKIAGTDLSHLLIPIGSVSVEQLQRLIDSGEGDGLHPVLIKSTEDVKAEYEEYQRLASVDIIFDTAYLRSLRMISDEIGDSDLNEATDMVIDLENLSTLIRGARQGQSQSFLHSVLSSQGKIRRRDLLTYFKEKDLNGLIDRFRSTKYGDHLDDVLKIIVEKGIHAVNMDQAIQREFAEEFRDYQYKPFGPMPVIAYLYFLESEVNNIRLILTGKENDLPIDYIKERMRPIYDL